MTHQVSRSALKPQPRLDKYGYNCIARNISLAIFISAPLFIGAGTLRWDDAWIYATIAMVGWLASSLIVAMFNPEILNERGKRAKALIGTKQWDWIVMSIYGVLLIGTPLIAGFDYPYTLSVSNTGWLKVTGAVLLIIGFIPLTWAMMANRFFEATVRIQNNRGHQVITSGPYRYVRHPGYIGVILHFIAVPLMLGTNLAWIPALIGAALFVFRTAMEDAMLRRELSGYQDYANRVRYRLLPGIW